MKKLTIIFGGTVGLYLQTIREIEKHFQKTIQRTSFFKFETIIKKTKTEFLFCNYPTKDKSYFRGKKYQKTKGKELMPPPSDELAKKIKTGKIIFAGFCGGFKGKKDDIHTPTEFSEILFKGNYIKHSEIKNLKPKNKIKLNNFLTKIIKAKKSKIITSNIGFVPGRIENEDENQLIILSNKMSKFFDAVEMETYPLVKKFKNKIPLGIFLMTSDMIHIKKQMLRHGNFNPNREKFNEYLIKIIEKTL